MEEITSGCSLASDSCYWSQHRIPCSLCQWDEWDERCILLFSSRPSANAPSTIPEPIYELICGTTACTVQWLVYTTRLRADPLASPTTQLAPKHVLRVVCTPERCRYLFDIIMAFIVRTPRSVCTRYLVVVLCQLWLSQIG